MTDDEKRVTVHVSRDLHSKVKAEAARRGLTLSEVVRDMLHSFVGDKPARKPARKSKGGAIGEAK